MADSLNHLPSSFPNGHAVLAIFKAVFPFMCFVFHVFYLSSPTLATKKQGFTGKT